MSGQLNDALEKAIAAIPECMAAGYVDLSTGMLLGLRTTDSQPAEIIELLAAATTDLFQGSNVVTIENLYRRARGLPRAQPYFQELIVNSEHTVHLFLRARSNVEQVACFVCRRTDHVDTAMAEARACMPAVEVAL